MKKNINDLRDIYNDATNQLKKCDELTKTTSIQKHSHKAIDDLNKMNHNSDFDFDDELDALGSGRANHKAVLLSIAQKFQVYMRNHVSFDTQRAIKVIKRDLDSKDFTSKYDPHHFYRAYLESYYYLAPCSDANCLSDDLSHCRYQNIKGDLKTITSNREDLMHISHTGNIKKYMGQTEVESVKRHNAD